LHLGPTPHRFSQVNLSPTFDEILSFRFWLKIQQFFFVKSTCSTAFFSQVRSMHAVSMSEALNLKAPAICAPSSKSSVTDGVRQPMEKNLAHLVQWWAADKKRVNGCDKLNRWLAMVSCQELVTGPYIQHCVSSYFYC